MKKSAFAIAALLGFFVLAAAGSANAQQSFRVVIPFDFVAGKAILPAGEYAVERPANGGTALLILGYHGGPSAIVMTNSVQSKEWQSESCLVFHRYGNRYFLSQMWTAGNQLGRELRISPAEKELARNETPRAITLVARLIVPKH